MTMQWQEYFITTSEGGAQRYRDIINTCTTELAKLFESAPGPYSGLCPTELQERIFDIDLSAAGVVSLEDAIKETSREIARHAIIVQHPHCIAHLHTPPLISGLAAESFIAAQNLSMDSWDQSGAATYVEQLVVRYLCNMFSYPAQSDGVFTSGGTQSNIMALMIARDWFLWNRHQHNVQRDGLPDYASRLRIIASSKSHFTIEKAASIMGLGQKAVVRIQSRRDGTIDVEQLDAAIQNLKKDGLIPFAVVGTAGTTDHGAVDDLVTIGQIANRHALWFHVDAAYGAALILSNQKNRLAGIDQADSMTVDFHKLWFQPVSCGALLLRDGTGFGHLTIKSEYLNRETDDLPNLVEKTISTTRRFDALKMYITLRAVGTQKLGAMIDHLLQLTLAAAKAIHQLPEFELLAPPCLTTVLFRYIASTSGESIDGFNRKLRSVLLKTGVAVIGETTVDGKASLKLTLLNPCLTIDELNSLFQRISVVAQNLISGNVLMEQPQKFMRTSSRLGTVR